MKWGDLRVKHMDGTVAIVFSESPETFSLHCLVILCRCVCYHLILYIIHNMGITILSFEYNKDYSTQILPFLVKPYLI